VEDERQALRGEGLVAALAARSVVLFLLLLWLLLLLLLLLFRIHRVMLLLVRIRRLFGLQVGVHCREQLPQRPPLPPAERPEAVERHGQLFGRHALRVLRRQLERGGAQRL
jgi:hypothetical protein